MEQHVHQHTNETQHYKVMRNERTCETWILGKRDIESLMAFEMKCYRRVLHIHWQQKITNLEIRQRLDIKHNVMQMTMERKLKLFGHICRMDDNRLMTNLVFGIIDGLNRRKTEQRVDGRHQRMVSDRCANTRHHGSGPFRVETSCHGGIGHQRAQVHGIMKKKKTKTLVGDPFRKSSRRQNTVLTDKCSLSRLQTRPGRNRTVKNEARAFCNCEFNCFRFSSTLERNDNQ